MSLQYAKEKMVPFEKEIDEERKSLEPAFEEGKEITQEQKKELYMLQ